MTDEYRAHELVGREPIDVKEFESRHDPEESMRLTYYLKSAGDLLSVAEAFARDETTGSWVGTSRETGTFRAHMLVSLVNDGPVTLLLDSGKAF